MKKSRLFHIFGIFPEAGSEGWRLNLSEGNVSFTTPMSLRTHQVKETLPLLHLLPALRENLLSFCLLW